ncbi:MAG: urea amidolyase associated protein UAAP1 [Caulobacterales bacterium]
MSSTADPKSAQAHARAQANTRVESMPIFPASSAPAAGVAPDDMLWAETIAPGGYASKRLDRGARLLLEDVQGDACVSLIAFNAEQTTERLNVADTLKVQWNAYLGAGSLLLSDMGRALFSILEDDAGTYDAFCGPSTQASNARNYGEGDNHGPHPNARDRFLIALGKYGLGRKDLHPCINVFKSVRIEDDGGVTLNAGPFAPGRKVLLRAEMNVIVVLANCPHVRDPRKAYSVTPAKGLAWRGPVTPAHDPVRNSTPEKQRAFLNVDDYYLR